METLFHMNPPHDSPGSGPFATTHWSLVLAAGAMGTAQAAAALEHLCQAYWKPLFDYARRRQLDMHAAEDLTQSFFTRLLEKNDLSQADPARGRFRAFLLTSFQHFMANEWDRAHTLKRGGDHRIVPLDHQLHADAAADLSAITPEQHYERQWATTLLNRVLSRLASEQKESGNGPLFDSLKENLVRSQDAATLASISKELGLSEPATRMAVSRLRRRYQELLRDEIAQTVASAAEVDDEIRHLFQSFSR
jgi:RNA polymerase sigma-70 factor (ECF subfamily)